MVSLLVWSHGVHVSQSGLEYDGDSLVVVFQWWLVILWVVVGGGHMPLGRFIRVTGVVT